MTRDEMLAELAWTPIDLTPHRDEDGDLEAWRLNMEMRRPGRVFRRKDGTYLLVGDVNENGGTCSCCSRLNAAHQWEDVEAYADILPPQPPAAPEGFEVNSPSYRFGVKFIDAAGEEIP